MNPNSFKLWAAGESCRVSISHSLDNSVEGHCWKARKILATLNLPTASCLPRSALGKGPVSIQTENLEAQIYVTRLHINTSPFLEMINVSRENKYEKNHSENLF